jgi:hypothetical protein
MTRRCPVQEQFHAGVKIIAKHPEYKSYAQAFAGVVERGIRVFEEE